MAADRTADRSSVTSRRPLAVLAAVAAIVVALDLASKTAAELLLAGPAIPLAGTFSLTLARNEGFVWGLYLGAAAPALQTAFTLAVAVLILRACAELAQVDRRAPIALGLIVGAGIGNLASALASPSGVTDFIAWSHGGIETAFNIADVALAAGLALSLATAAAIVRAIAVERRGYATLAVARAGLAHSARQTELELVRVVFDERAPSAASGAPSAGPRDVAPHDADTAARQDA